MVGSSCLTVFRILIQMISHQNVDIFTLIVFHCSGSPIKYNLIYEYVCLLSVLRISFFLFIPDILKIFQEVSHAS